MNEIVSRQKQLSQGETILNWKDISPNGSKHQGEV